MPSVDSRWPHALGLEGTAVAEGTSLGTLHRAWIAAYDDAAHDLLLADARDLVEAQDLSVRVAGRLIKDVDVN